MSSDLLRPWILASFAKSLSSSRLSSEAASSTDFMCSSDASANVNTSSSLDSSSSIPWTGLSVGGVVSCGNARDDCRAAMAASRSEMSL
jgi:hypothetical protein